MFLIVFVQFPLVILKHVKQSPQCHACKGALKEGQTTVTVDFGSGVVVIRYVPATVCSQCGMEYIDDKIVEKIESLVNDAREKHSAPGLRVITKSGNLVMGKLART